MRPLRHGGTALSRARHSGQDISESKTVTFKHDTAELHMVNQVVVSKLSLDISNTPYATAMLHCFLYAHRSCTKFSLLRNRRLLVHRPPFQPLSSFVTLQRRQRLVLWYDRCRSSDQAPSMISLVELFADLLH